MARPFGGAPAELGAWGVSVSVTGVCPGAAGIAPGGRIRTACESVVLKTPAPDFPPVKSIEYFPDSAGWFVERSDGGGSTHR